MHILLLLMMMGLMAFLVHLLIGELLVVMLEDIHQKALQELLTTTVILVVDGIILLPMDSQPVTHIYIIPTSAITVGRIIATEHYSLTTAPPLL